MRAARPLWVAILLSLAWYAVASAQSAPPYVLQWGSFGSAIGLFNAPTFMTTDASNSVYVCDTGNQRVQKFTGAGTYQGSFTGFDMNGPRGIVFVPNANEFFITDPSSGGATSVRKYSAAGSPLLSFGGLGSGSGLFNQPAGIAYANGSLFIVDSGNNRIQRFTTAGAFQLAFGSRAPTWPVHGSPGIADASATSTSPT
jgi:DNA-binding beta-propeller fold protein YncE